MSEKGDVNAYGVLIEITAKTGELMAWAASKGAEHFAEVCVRHNGRELEYTLKDFLERLGFNEEANDG